MVINNDEDLEYELAKWFEAWSNDSPEAESLALAIMDLGYRAFRFGMLSAQVWHAAEQLIRDPHIRVRSRWVRIRSHEDIV